jgi:hypothetical protein
MKVLLMAPQASLCMEIFAWITEAATPLIHSESLLVFLALIRTSGVHEDHINLLTGLILPIGIALITELCVFEDSFPD